MFELGLFTVFPLVIESISLDDNLLRDKILDDFHCTKNEVFH